MEKNYYLVDEEGEVIDEVLGEVKNGRVVVLNEGDRIIRKNTQITFNDRKNNYGEAKIDFVKVNRSCIDRITWECPLVMVLAKYISYPNNMLSYSNGKILTPTNLSRVTGISLSTCKRQFKKLIELGIIRKVLIEKRYAYFFDPYVANCSKDIRLDTLKMFKDSIYREVK